ncbi:restriction endonuclease subunit S [Hyunsoonleella sp. SJ7]|uniref:Restriction endonuclease subunit S n=1 Tax=Hyunsoonleella aquatilis TaxID=2762758 RepID=A0A923HK04_9FLAO|nr:restriction endonuclease subunit S [Hyunsoonleella aquatilis]MBC3759707.1 restriction endonuclease subunit S [Hyunsoonleella aquatilis]
MKEVKVNIPDGWKLKKLGAACEIKKGVQFNKIDLSDYGMYPCINGGIEPSGYSDLWNTNEKTITISEGGNSCGYINLITTKFWSGGHCYSLLDLDKELDNGFLYQALKGRQHLIMDLRVGSGLPNIQQKAIKEFEFLIPENPKEQTQIASILSKVDEAITQTEKLIAKYQRIKTGLMQDLLTKGIDKDGNIREEATHQFKDSQLGRIPVEWNIEILDNCKMKGTSITYGIVQTFEHIEDGVPVLRTIDLGENGINPLKNLLRTKQSISDKYKRTILSENDIVCNVRASVGDFNLVSSEYINCNTTRGVARICPNSDLNPNYLVWFLKSYRNERQMELLIKGTTFIDINISDLRQIWILLPQIDEQNLIASKLDKIQKSFRFYDTQLSKLHSIKRGLMQDLLSGKKRVTHLIKQTV